MKTITQGNIHIFTYKEGILARLAHDLRLSIEHFEIQTDEKKVHCVFESSSLNVDGTMSNGILNPHQLSAKDCNDILKNTANDVLYSNRYPKIIFDGKIDIQNNSLATVKGILELVGKQRQLTFQVERKNERLLGKVHIVPSQWGIKPFKAALGAIRIQDQVLISFDLRACAEPK